LTRTALSDGSGLQKILHKVEAGWFLEQTFNQNYGTSAENTSVLRALSELNSLTIP
jgi:hypothetical protein